MTNLGPLMKKLQAQHKLSESRLQAKDTSAQQSILKTNTEQQGLVRLSARKRALENATSSTLEKVPQLRKMVVDKSPESRPELKP